MNSEITNTIALVFGDKCSVGTVVKAYWYIFPVSFAVSLVATALFRMLALRLGVVDYPDNKVKTHAKPTAYMGGMGILTGLLAGITIGFWIIFTNPPAAATHGSSNLTGIPVWRLLAGITIGAVLSCIVGLIDDIVDLKPSRKLLGQAICAAIIFAVGIRPNLHHLFNHLHLNLPPMWDFLLGIPLVLFFILGASNSLNLLDGLDGLCAGVTSIMTLAYLFLAVFLATWNYSPTGDPIRLIVCLALAGATLGFLPLNHHPARIFMGDAGSMLLGFLIGTLMLLFTETTGRWSVAAIIIFGLPMLDTAVALVRRFANKRPLFISDRGHMYDQLMDRGWGLTKTVKTFYLLEVAFAIIGIAAAMIRFRYAVVLFLLVLLICVIVVYRGGFLHMPPLEDETGNHTGNTSKQ